MGRSDDVRIGRLSWAHRSYGDAGMNQSIALDEYRRLDRGTCWAVALLTYSGASDATPPRLPPFTAGQRTLRAILARTTFLPVR